MRLTWAQPEDLLPHELVQSACEGRELADLAERWTSAGGSLTPAVSGASPDPAPPHLRDLARELLIELDARPPDAGRAADEPSTWEGMAAQLTPAPIREPVPGTARERLTGAWLGRCAGCVMGKPVEKIPREGIRELLTSAGRWPLNGLFSARGVPKQVLDRWPWNRRSAPTSLAENLRGMP
nr:ADP-ribosylglycohydrolase family protein [Actinomycetales bacterium]